MAKKQKQPTKTCADCIHESACRVWTDGRAISDASASQCPNHETVKESGAYLCGVLDERKRKQTNGDRIRAMSDEELAKFLKSLAFGRETPWADPFARKLCDNCPTIICVAKETGEEMELHECDFEDGECPHGDDILWWLKEPVEEEENG